MGGRYFKADIPKGKIDLKNKTGDILDFSAELTGITSIEDGDYDGEFEVVEETKDFDIHAVIGDKTSTMMEQHMKESDIKVNSKIRGNHWSVLISGNIDGNEIENIEGSLSKLIWYTTTIGQVITEPEPEPELKTQSQKSSVMNTQKGKPEIVEGRIFQMVAASGGEVEYEEGDISGWYSYSWYFDISYDNSNDKYLISISQSDHMFNEVSRLFTSEIPASKIDIPLSLSGPVVLDLEIEGDLTVTTTIWPVDPDESDIVQNKDFFEDVTLDIYLVLDLIESGSGTFVMKGSNVESKIIQKGSSMLFKGIPSGTVSRMPGLESREDIGTGYFAEVTIGEYRTRTKGEAMGF